MDSSHTPNLHWVSAVFLTLHGLRWPHLHEVKATNLKHTKQVPQKAIIRKKATERQRKVFCLIFPTNQKIPAVGSLSTPQSTSLVCIAPSVSLCKLTLLPFSSGNDPLGPGPWAPPPYSWHTHFLWLTSWTVLSVLSEWVHWEGGTGRGLQPPLSITSHHKNQTKNTATEQQQNDNNRIL